MICSQLRIVVWAGVEEGVSLKIEKQVAVPRRLQSAVVTAKTHLHMSLME